MSAASILPQAPETAMLQRSTAGTLEEERHELGILHHSLEADTNTLAAKVFEHFLRFQQSHEASGFYTWLENGANIPRSTAHRYLRVALALKQGVTGSVMDLAAAGKGLENGMTPADAQAAIDEGRIKHKADAQADKGCVRIPIPEWGVGIQRELKQRFPALPEPELVGLAIQFAHEAGEVFAHFVERES